MKRRNVGLICLLFIVIAALVFLYSFGLPPFYRVVPLTIPELCSNPEFWTGRRVRVQGVFLGPLVSIPEEVPPYNHVLEDPSTQKRFGVLWREFCTDLHGRNVTVIGVVRRGQTEPLVIRTVYYIEAEIITTTE